MKNKRKIILPKVKNLPLSNKFVGSFLNLCSCFVDTYLSNDYSDR